MDNVQAFLLCVWAAVIVWLLWNRSRPVTAFIIVDILISIIVVIVSLAIKAKRKVI